MALLMPAPLWAQTYTSPYSINLGPDISAWTSDFGDRTSAIEANWEPAQSDWSTISSHDYPYGPVLPQLYTSSSSANPDLTGTLQYDRGHGVYDVAINSVPEGVNTVTWEQQRLLEAATQLIGTAYQHTHLPQFDPAPAVNNNTYTWLPVSSNTNLTSTQELNGPIPPNPPTVPNPYKAVYGQPAPGIDCTDFSAYIYNEALGIQMHSGTSTQVQFTSGTKPAVGNMPTAIVLSNTGEVINPNFILGPNYGTNAVNNGTTDATRMNQIMSELQPGDLLYMHDDNGVAHVVIWLGQYGSQSDLVISSHDDTPAIFSTPDSNLNDYGLPIMDTVTGLPYDYSDPLNPPDLSDLLAPPGVEILPFTPDTWFYQNFSFAMQIIPGEVPEPSQYGGLMVLILAGAFVCRRVRAAV